MAKQAKSQPKHILAEDGVYQEIEHELYTGYKKLELPEGTATPQWKGAKVPFDLWVEMVQWCEVSFEKFKGETLCFLYYDLDNHAWSVLYPPQKSMGMTVEADLDDPRYVDLRKQHGSSIQLGSLHHHCEISAFQSGTDSSDEDDRDGLHFTVGNLKDDKYSLHARFSIEGESHEIPVESVVEPPHWAVHIPEEYKADILKKALAMPTKHHNFVKDFTDQLDLVSVTKASSRPYIGGGWGYGSWWDDEPELGAPKKVTKPKTQKLQQQLIDEITECYQFSWGQEFFNQPATQRGFDNCVDDAGVIAYLCWANTLAKPGEDKENLHSYIADLCSIDEMTQLFKDAAKIVGIPYPVTYEHIQTLNKVVEESMATSS